jgi:hypothetical protein
LKRKYFWIFFSITLGLCAGLGFLIGAFPETWQKLRGRNPDKIVLLTSSEKLIPADFFYDFEKATGKTVDVKSIESFHLFKTEAQNVDLLFAPLSWLGSFPDILSEPPDLPKMLDLLSTDFASLKLDLHRFLPVLWRTTEHDNRTHLEIWGFATPLDSNGSPQDLVFFLLSNQNRLREWAQQTDLNFTLRQTDQIDEFPETKKASHLRNIPLQKLVIDQKFE